MGRPIKGRLFKSGENKSYYLQYYINKTEFKRVLRDENKKPITKLREAEKARDLILAPYYAKDDVQLREQAVAALNTASDKAALATAIANPPLTIADAWTAYKDSQNRPQSGEATLKDYQIQFGIFCKWLKTQPENPIYLRDVTPELAERFAAYLSNSGRSATTFNKYITFLHLLFETLEKPGRIITNPFIKKVITRKKLNKSNTNSRRELSIEELKNILNSAQGDMALLMALGTFTGLRLGDCCTLKWNEIDLINRVIKRVPNKTAGRKNKPVLIGIPGPLYERLAGIAPKKRCGFLLPEFANKYRTASGRNIITNTIQDFFKGIGIETQRPGTGIKWIPDEKTGKLKRTGTRAVVDVGFHSLRHTYISIHSNAGTPQAIIQGNVGHSNPAMTEHYTHISMEAARQVAGALETPFMDIQAVVIPPEPERDKLAELVKTLPIEKIREVLVIIENRKEPAIEGATGNDNN